jgi:hypothetical protein
MLLFPNFQRSFDFTFCPFLNWECKGKSRYNIIQIFLNFFILFSFEKSPFFNWECKGKGG